MLLNETEDKMTIRQVVDQHNAGVAAHGRALGEMYGLVGDEDLEAAARVVFLTTATDVGLVSTRYVGPRWVEGLGCQPRRFVAGDGPAITEFTPWPVCGKCGKRQVGTAIDLSYLPEGFEGESA
jgi:hypothetical protein